MAEDEFKEVCKLSRKPSVLLVPIPENRPRSPCAPPTQKFHNGSPNSEDEREGRSILDWNEDDIAAWLAELGFQEYQKKFTEHAISSGHVLLELQESHLLEMGVAQVGHRLQLRRHLNELKERAGLTQPTDLTSLRQKLDKQREEQLLKNYPRRIILIRHGESQGNVDKSMYATVPDNKLPLTERGKRQAYAAGIELKKLVGGQSVTFYVSPFTRSKQTYEHIRQSFPDEQVVAHKEDPRLREQEWGNFQDPTQMEAIMDERRKTGAFYYRFPTGESGADVFDRVSMFLETLYRDMQKGLCGQNVLLISHGLFCRLFLTRFYHWSVEYFHKLWNFDNTQFAIMELNSEGYYQLISPLKSDP